VTKIKSASLAVLAISFVALLCFSPNSLSQQSATLADLSGRVTSTDGKPLEGIGVSAREKDQRFTTTVYTDQAGAYLFPSLASGHYKIWAQTIGFEATVRDVDLASGSNQKMELMLSKLDDFQRQLSGPEMLESLPGDTPADRRMKEVFANVCTSCHPASFTLQNRFDAAGWDTIVT
jgi:carboxypeptidase family protein